MAQRVKMVDLTKSYVPGDPNAFPNNLQFTAKEDDPVQSLPILAYEGYNFLPTSYGYRSYFGTDSSLTLEALPKPCDEIITFQSKEYENMLIAFCSDGIRTAKAGATVWTHSVPLPDDYTNLQVYRQYTWCVIENNLYIYRQGHTHVIKIDDAHVITQFIPSFLNMSGQIGMFRGNGRLCFWDSENSVAWSSAFDLTDFTPSIENMVGNTIFLGVLGRIVNILPHGEGYVVYSTRSIVGVSYNTTGTVVWDAMTITSAGGIAHPKACCVGQNDKEHFCYSTLGIISIGHFNALSRQYAMEVILPELFDYLKESRDPVYMYCHAARFLYFCLIDDAYINGITSFTGVAVPTSQAPVITIDKAFIDSIKATGFPPTESETFQMVDSFLRNPTGNLRVDYTADVFDMPRWTLSGHFPGVPSAANIPSLFPNDPTIGFITSATRPPIDLFRAGTSADATAEIAAVEGMVWPGWNDITLAEADIVDAYYNSSQVSDPYYTCAYLNLYPGNELPVHPSNSSGKSCWDFLFNAGCIYDDAYNDLKDLTAAYPNKPTLSFELIFQSEDMAPNFNAIESLVNAEIPASSQKSSNILVTLDRSQIIPQLNFVNYSTMLTKLSLESIQRTVVDYEFIADPGSGGTNPDEPTVANKWTVGIQAGVTWRVNFDTEPTPTEVRNRMLINPLFVNGNRYALYLGTPEYLLQLTYWTKIRSYAVLQNMDDPVDRISASMTCNYGYFSSSNLDKYQLPQTADGADWQDLNDINNGGRNTKNSPLYNLRLDTSQPAPYKFSSLSILEYCLNMARPNMLQYYPTLAEWYNLDPNTQIWTYDRCKPSAPISIVPSTLFGQYYFEALGNVAWQFGGGASSAIQHIIAQRW
jgi:hypothetical protein